MSLFLRGAGLVMLLLALCGATALASPPDEAPAYWPFHLLERGAASCRVLGVPGRGLVLQTLGDESALARFWARTHGPVEGKPARPPRIDFSQRMVVVVVGRAGSASIHAQKMWTLPPRQLVVGLFNPLWPDIPMDPQRVPYEVLVVKRSPHPLVAFERPAARALHALTQQALQRLTLPDSGADGMNDEHAGEVRKVWAARGETLLAALRRLPKPRHNDPEEPYTYLLEATLQHRFLDRPEEARRAWREVVLLWPGSVPARLAKSRLVMLDRRPRDEEARRVLDDARHALAAERTVTSGHAQRWSDLAQQYEYLTSLAPLSLLLAARCYVEAARDPADDDRVQNALLQAASIHELHFDLDVASRLYWQCVKRYPDAASVPTVIHRLGVIGWEQRSPRAEALFCRRFLRAWPRSRNAPAVRVMLKRASAP